MGGIEAVLVRAYHQLPPLLRIDVVLYRGRTDACAAQASRRARVVAARPQRRQAAFEVWEFLPKPVRACALQAVHDLADCQTGRKRSKQVNVVGLYDQLGDLPFKRSHDFTQQRIEAPSHLACQYRTAKL